MLDTKSDSKLQHFAHRHVAFLTRRHCTISSYGHIMKEHVPSKAIQNITKRLLAIPQYQRKEVFSYGMESLLQKYMPSLRTCAVKDHL